MTEFVNRVRQTAEKKVIFSLHALNEMNSEKEIITMGEIMLVIRNGELIEDYPEDKRGHSCLMYSLTNKGRPMKCLMCEGDTERQLVSYTIDREGYHLYIEKIPALVCMKCREQYFEEKEVGLIQEMIQSIEEKLENITTAA